LGCEFLQCVENFWLAPTINRCRGKNFKQRPVNIILGILRDFSSPAVNEHNLYSLQVFMLGHAVIRNSIFSAKILIVAAKMAKNVDLFTKALRY
jgi:hypothetical protein